MRLVFNGALMSIFFAVYFAAASAYVLLAIGCMLKQRREGNLRTTPLPPISVLKPVYGLDANLYQNLRSFCEQDYPNFQIVFGVADPNDAALQVIHQLLADLPERDLSITVSGLQIGSNRKISNVWNCLKLAKHDLLVIADSDMRVGADYLRHLAAGFEKQNVGAVTCLYKGKAAGGVSSVLGATFINEWFMPSVLVALKFQKIRFCFGATMGIRRAVLEEIGGLERLANELADDYMLGNLVAEHGHEVALVPYLVENVVYEPNLRSLLAHELRWARTVRSVQPLGYTLSFLTYVVPAALGLAVAAGNPIIGLSAVTFAIGLRVLMHDVARLSVDPATATHSPALYGLAVVRDLLCFGVWATSFVSRDVEWRGHSFRVDRHGQLELKEITSR